MLTGCNGNIFQYRLLRRRGALSEARLPPRGAYTSLASEVFSSEPYLVSACSATMNKTVDVSHSQDVSHSFTERCHDEHLGLVQQPPVQLRRLPVDPAR